MSHNNRLAALERAETARRFADLADPDYVRGMTPDEVDALDDDALTVLCTGDPTRRRADFSEVERLAMIHAMEQDLGLQPGEEVSV